MCFWRLPGRSASRVDARYVRREPTWLFGRIGLGLYSEPRLNKRRTSIEGEEKSQLILGPVFRAEYIFCLCPLFGR